MKYYEIINHKRKLFEKVKKSEVYKITVLSNIIVNRLQDYMEYDLRVEGINCHVNYGDYDNIIQESTICSDSNLVIIFYEISNIIEGLQYKIEIMDNSKINNIYERIKSEIDLIFKNLEKNSLVLFNKFISSQFCNSNLRKNNFEILANRLNQYIKNKNQLNIKLVNIEKVIKNIGIEKSLDLRYYYSSKSLYSNDFFEAYSRYIKPYIMSANGKTKKALIFDCDNTLWKGILGEDGYDKIEMSSETKDGTIFFEIQNIALDLNKRGVIIGLCSKNNLDDVNKVIKFHPNMTIKEHNITINKSNWLDKATNLINIAKELNIGLDSMVFIDDSSFEVNLIKEQLPEITVLQVPKKLYNYPQMLRDNIELFYNLSYTKEDNKKIKMYKQQTYRQKAKERYLDINEYLKSLGLVVKVYVDDNNIISRISQMTQKTNQFNLTTKRYTETDIRKFIESKNYIVFAESISDKYGDSGITGLCIIKFNNKKLTADIDTFLMSCRIIGRNIEYAFMDYIIEFIKNKNISYVTSYYSKTYKNEQVKEYYDKCSYSLIKSSDEKRIYKLFVDKYQPKNYKYIEVKNGK